MSNATTTQPAVAMLEAWGLKDTARRVGVKVYDALTATGQPGIAWDIRHPLTGDVFYRQQERTTDKTLRWGAPFDDKPTPHISALEGAQAAAGGEGVLHIAKGIKEYLMLLNIGIDNVLYLTRETLSKDAAKEIVDVCQAWGVSRVVYAPDRDDAGVKSAVTIRDAVSAANIFYDVLELPFEHQPSKGLDLFDFGQPFASGGEFLAALGELPALSLPAPTPPPPTPRAYDYDSANRYNEWVATVALPALDAVAPARNRAGLRHCPNPAHDDKNPSFRVSYDRSDMGIGQCSCETGINWNTIAAWVGAQPFGEWVKERYPRTSRRSCHRTATTSSVTTTTTTAMTSTTDTTTDALTLTINDTLTADVTACPFPAGLPIAWHKALTEYCRGMTAPVAWAVIEAATKGMLNPSAFTIDDAHRACIDHGVSIKRDTVRKLMTGDDSIFIPHDDGWHVLESIEDKDNRLSKTCQAKHFLLDRDRMKRRLLDNVKPRLIEKYHIDNDGQMFIAALDYEFVANAGGDDSLYSDLLEVYAHHDDDDDDKRRAAINKYFNKLEELDDELTTDNSAAPLKPVGELKTKTDYLAARARGLWAGDEQQLSRGDMRQALACSNGSLDSVMKKANMQSRDNFQTLQLTNITQAEANIENFGASHKGMPFLLEVLAADGRTVIEADTFNKSSKLIAEQIERLQAMHGQDVQFRLAYRCASFRWIDDTLPELPTDATDTDATTTDTDTATTSSAGDDTTTHDDKPRKPRKPKHYGRTFDPAWLIEQMRLRLRLTGLPEYAAAEAFFIHASTCGLECGQVAEVTPLLLMQIAAGRVVCDPILPEGAVIAVGNLGDYQ